MSRARYFRIVRFFAWMIFKLVFWELFLRNIGFRKLAARTRSGRLRAIASTYRGIAIQMGGVLIKVGQFLSARADILPEEITLELSGLQDEVPAEDFEGIRQLAETEFGTPLAEKYSYFEEEPFAAASLGQVHRAKLSEPSEDSKNQLVDVVVKIQRPDIEMIIATDVAALNTVGSWLMRYRPIRRRADVPALLGEFTRILYEEIDYLAEGKNANIFGEQFKDTPGVRIPDVVWSHTTLRVLTLEDVYAIKITDYPEITAAGVDRSRAAKRLFDVYLQQIFENEFFHADPHPGNLFIDPGKRATDDKSDWQLTFVDFGMVGRIPPNARSGLRELAIAVGTKDSKRLVKSYQLLNVLLPHADLDLIAEAEALAFDRFWGKSMEELRQISFEEMHEFAVEFRELVYSMPFQLPHDLIFLFRTVAILSGICTGLDPAFNVWENIAPYARKMLAEDGESGWEVILEEAGSLFRALIALPQQLSSVLEKMDRGSLRVRAPDIDRSMRRIDRGLGRITYALIFFALLTNGVLLHLGGQIQFALLLYLGAGFSLIRILLTRRHRS